MTHERKISGETKGNNRLCRFIEVNIYIYYLCGALPAQSDTCLGSGWVGKSPSLARSNPFLHDCRETGLAGQATIFPHPGRPKIWVRLIGESDTLSCPDRPNPLQLWGSRSGWAAKSPTFSICPRSGWVRKTRRSLFPVSHTIKGRTKGDCVSPANQISYVVTYYNAADPLHSTMSISSLCSPHSSVSSLGFQKYCVLITVIFWKVL